MCVIIVKPHISVSTEDKNYTMGVHIIFVLACLIMSIFHHYPNIEYVNIWFKHSFLSTHLNHTFIAASCENGSYAFRPDYLKPNMCIWAVWSEVMLFAIKSLTIVLWSHYVSPDQTERCAGWVGYIYDGRIWNKTHFRMTRVIKNLIANCKWHILAQCFSIQNWIQNSKLVNKGSLSRRSGTISRRADRVRQTLWLDN